MRIVLKILLICCSLHFNASFAQVNLIQNGSFEVLDSCPPDTNLPNFSSIQYALGWSDALENNINPNYSSPDLFNTCNSSIFGVPINFYGYQLALDGNGYAGIVIDANRQAASWREFIQNELSAPTIKGCKYKVSFNFSYSSKSSYKTDGLQLILSKSRLTIPSDEALLNGTYFTFDEDSVTIIRFPELLEADTTDWWYFEREFYSNSALRYVTIGSILDSTNTNNEFGWYINGIGINSKCRGYFDDIRLIQLDSTCVENVTGGIEERERENVKVYPNPAKASLTIELPEGKNSAIFNMYDIYGRFILSMNLTQSIQQINPGNLSAGIYLYEVLSIDGSIIGKDRLLINQE